MDFGKDSMRSCVLILFLALVLCVPLSAQIFEYGNDWYTGRQEQSFIKMTLSQEGIYRVTRQDLEEAGYDLTGANSINLKVFYRGEQIPIYVHSPSSGGWTSFEFYGKRNDGSLDARMYRDPITRLWQADLQPDPDVSLFSDQSAYFLTWDSSPGLRYEGFFSSAYGDFTPETSLRYRAKREYHPDSAQVVFQTSGGSTNSSQYSLNSDYGPGEGYMYSPAFAPGTPRIINVPTPSPANTGTPHRIRVRTYGISSGLHDLRVELNGNINDPVIDTTDIRGVYVRSFSRTIQAGLDLNNELKFIATLKDNNNANTNRICWADILYDRLPDLGGQATLPVYEWAKTQAAYLSLSNVQGQDSVFVFDVANRRRSAGTIAGNSGQIILAPGTGTRSLFISSDQGILTPTIAPHKLRDFTNFAGAEFVIIANRNHQSSAEAYALYRDTVRINSLSTTIVYTDELFDQFSYGSLTPWALKRFCKYALDTWEIKPRYFLLWGKGYSNPRPNQPALVPTYGHPATDHEFISHFDPNSRELNPEAAIGRVNIFNDEEGFQYLEKVKEYEKTPWETWMKQAVFLGGGANEAEQNFIGSGLERGVEDFQNAFYGGQTTYFQKRAGVTVLDPSSAGFHDRISQGVLLIHFFGHSAVNIQDVDIREANEYSNFGRYPLVMAMGCYGGNFTGGRSFGERWVIQKDRGGIGYLANSNIGIISSLRSYSNVFYNTWFNELPIGTALGDLIATTIDRYTATNQTVGSFNHARQMNLQGDPSIKLYYPQFPDLAIDRSSIFFSPEVFTAQDDSFQINVVIENRALVRVDTFWVSVEQSLPDGSIVDHGQIRMGLPANQDTLSMWLANTSREKGIGENTFKVTLDTRNEIQEYEEDNNSAELTIAVPGNVANPLFPANFAVVGSNQVELVASAFFASEAGELGYIFEIDTTLSFSSPLLNRSGTVMGSPYFISWNPPISFQDSTVYFWRVRLSDVEPLVWRQSSFTYLPNNSGWAQGNAFQFSSNPVEEVSIDLSTEQWKFDPQAVQISLVVRPGGLYTYLINNAFVSDGALTAYNRNSVLYNVFDQNTVKSVYDDQFLGGGLHAADMPGELHKLKVAIQNTRHGDYFLLGSNRNPFVDTWDEETFTLLKDIGVSDNIRLLQNGDPFVLFGRKGYPNSAIEIYRPNSGNSLELEQLLFTQKDSGLIQSPLIGPALKWNKLFWKWRSIDIAPQENVKITLKGVDPEIRDSVLYLSETTEEIDLSEISPKEYPFLQLSARLVDSVKKTAPQLEAWYVLYEAIPDLTVDPITTLNFASDTINLGDTIRFELAVRNLTSTTTDSFWVQLDLERADRSRITLDSLYVVGVGGNAYNEVSFSIPSTDKFIPGQARLILEINPDESLLEQYYFNNTFQQNFFIEGDVSNPILDVTVDGRHILDGDIVSPRPEILVQIDDENPFLAVSDSNSFELYFGNSSIAANLERIFASDPRVEWIPASLPENKAQIRFNPGLEFALPDDTYTLRVQAKDPSGNLASSNGQFLELRFEVENDRTLTQVLNYPNPFSSSTRFVYTLTGEELPEVFQIQVFTLSGKQVKVIDLVELGDVHWGRNITEYAWDGTDEYGDPLGNGVYLYRTVVKFPSGFTLRTEGTEEYFKSGWGKMYLMR